MIGPIPFEYIQTQSTKMSGPGIIAGISRMIRYASESRRFATRSTSTAITIGRNTMPGRKIAVKIAARISPSRTSGSWNASM